MSGILKVDQIQLRDGSTPSASDLGLNIAGMVVQHQHLLLEYSGAVNEAETSSSSWTATPYAVTITPKYSNSKMIISGSISVKTTGSNYQYLALFKSVNGGAFTNTHTEAISRQDLRYNPMYGQISFEVVNIANTTDEIVYKIYQRANDGAQTVRIGDNATNEYLHVYEIAQ